MRRLNKQTKIKTFNIKSLRVYVMAGICGLLAITSIFLTIESATTGAEIASLQKTEGQLLSQQQDLESNLVQNLSVSSLQEKSTELGFIKVSNLVYVTGAATVARLP